MERKRCSVRCTRRSVTQIDNKVKYIKRNKRYIFCSTLFAFTTAYTVTRPHRRRPSSTSAYTVTLPHRRRLSSTSVFLFCRRAVSVKINLNSEGIE